MPDISRKTNECIIVTAAEGAGQVLQIEIAEINADRVLLRIEGHGGLSAQRLESWQKADTERSAARVTSGSNAPKVRPPYMN